MNWKVIWVYILERGKEKTTWVGVFTFAASVGGIAIAPEAASLITTAGTALAGLLIMAMKEKGSDK